MLPGVRLTKNGTDKCRWKLTFVLACRGGVCLSNVTWNACYGQ